MHLEHNHPVDREAVDIQEAQKGALTTPMKETAAKLTGMLCKGVRFVEDSVIPRLRPHVWGGQHGYIRLAV